jgi:hypothetical protein
MIDSPFTPEAEHEIRHLSDESRLQINREAPTDTLAKPKRVLSEQQQFDR